MSSKSLLPKSCFYCFLSIIALLVGFCPENADASMYLKDKLQTAEVGDYLVTALDKTYTVILIKEKTPQKMSIEEVTIPSANLRPYRPQWSGWKHWVQSGAPGNTSWVEYSIHRTSGQMTTYFSYTRNSWCQVSQVDNFLSKLLNLRMKRLREGDMKKVGPKPTGGISDNRRTWSPRMVFEGETVHDVVFEGWGTRWLKDNTDLSGKSIIVYLPTDDSKYPAYFPYWLEIRGMLGKAKIRIVDSGRNLQTPHTKGKNKVEPVPHTNQIL